MINIEEHFKLTGTPFSKGISTDSLYRSDNFNECVARASYAISNRNFAILTAPAGCGKSTMLRYIRDGLDAKRYVFIYIAESRLTPRWLYNEFLEFFGEKPYYYRGDARKAVHEKFAVLHDLKKKEIVCVIDESHLLNRETLEELRFFLNCDMDSTTPLSLVLSGQTELLAKLNKPDNEAIKQRVETEIRLNPLDNSLIPFYIKKHLDVVGCKERIFNDEALIAIEGYAKGLPRLINKACTAAMTYLAASNKYSITGDEMRAVIAKELP